MHPELLFQLKSITRLIYFVTEEEDRFLLELREALKDRAKSAKVYNVAFGLIPLMDLINDWKTKAHPEDHDTMPISAALTAMYKEATNDQKLYYVLTDPERWLADEGVQRRILNIIHQVHNDEEAIKFIICVGSTRYVPAKLARYTEVIYDTGLNADEILTVVARTCSALNVGLAKKKRQLLEVPADVEGTFKGMTSFEIRSAVIQTYKRSRSIDPKMLAEYRFRQLKKTDLVKHIDVSNRSFAQVGGIERFKKWALMAKVAWSPEGRAFGLEPPKGILAVGIWGTGKSLSIQTLGAVWGLPVVQLEMGMMRSSRVGETENNVYRATRIIEMMAPCIVWIDEAEKSLSGGHSSSYSDAGTTSRAIGILSTWMQETKAQICVAMTANSLKTLPVEFVNRMDERWFFDLPSHDDRIDILKIHLQKRTQNMASFDLARLSEAAKSLVGREIEQCIKAAMTASFVADPTKGLDEGILINELTRKPRIVKTMGDEIQETLDWVGYDPDVDDGVRARFAADPSGQERKFSIE